MPELNWAAFEGLAGSREDNFERLCRHLVRRHYGTYGRFRALSMQPGVEFHVHLDNDAPGLGKAREWWGWQCRWYDVSSGRQIGSARRGKIEDAIRTTERHLPEITDWVLWTRRPLTPTDQTWFDGIKTDMRLHLWTETELEEHLSGPGEIFRRSYFGDLILDSRELSLLCDRAIGPIRMRWIPEVHQESQAEVQVRKMLGEALGWDALQQACRWLKADLERLETDAEGVTHTHAAGLHQLISESQDVLGDLESAHDALVAQRLDAVGELLDRCQLPDLSRHGLLLSSLRAHNYVSALTATNVLQAARIGESLLVDLDELLGQSIVAVLADAGCGKTQLAAALVQQAGSRPAGLLLHGRDLSSRGSIDDLARRVSIDGQPVSSMEALLAALNGAAERAGCRLPLVIDGLNEAEDPRQWRHELAMLAQSLRDFSSVLVVLTLRPDFSTDCLPEIPQIELAGFERNTREAVAAYFRHYRINPRDADLPWDLFVHPLSLRLYCEVANPDRLQWVGAEALPSSLTQVFETYLTQSARRVDELSSAAHRISAVDVELALRVIGGLLWGQNGRAIGVKGLRSLLDDPGCRWHDSIVRAMEQEGLLLRVNDRETGEENAVALAYDALAGHVIASVLVEDMTDQVEQWFGDSANLGKITGSQESRHPLAPDILRSLVALLPRRTGLQAWPLLPEPSRSGALLDAAYLLEAEFLDVSTLDQVLPLVQSGGTQRRDILVRLMRTRGIVGHPLNVSFLTKALLPMTVALRDLRWSEWVRRNGEELREDLRRVSKVWQEETARSEGDELRAEWVAWLLTSNVRVLRDEAIRALLHFGRFAPESLFRLTLRFLTVNDAYVVQGVLAAGFGVTMSRQLPDADFAQALHEYLTGLQSALVAPGATSPTDDWLCRRYATGTFELARRFHEKAVPVDLVSGPIPFQPGPDVERLDQSDVRYEEAAHSLRMDFENYTIGGLFDDRRNYDDDHAVYKNGVAEVLSVVWGLGWREDELGDIDSRVLSRSDDVGRTERYGKKYGWIGFFALAGRMDAAAQLTRYEPISDLGIDPSFPEPTPPLEIALANWTASHPADDEQFVVNGRVAIPLGFLKPNALQGVDGPWVAVSGHLTLDVEKSGRRAFGLLYGLLVPGEHVEALGQILRGRKHPGRHWLPEVPIDYYTFAGEIPWSSHFAQFVDYPDLRSMYTRQLQRNEGESIEVECIAHGYGMESHQSETSVAGGALVPSKLFSQTLDLRAIPPSFNQVTAGGGTRDCVAECACRLPWPTALRP